MVEGNDNEESQEVRDKKSKNEKRRRNEEQSTKRQEEQERLRGRGQGRRREGIVGGEPGRWSAGEDVKKEKAERRRTEKVRKGGGR